MESLSVWSFYFTAIAFVSGIILRETSLAFPQKAIKIQNQPRKVLFLNSQARGEGKIGNLMYLKHLMELRCLKKAIEDTRYINHLKYQQSHKPQGVLLTQSFQNQISKGKKKRLNLSHIEAQNKMNPRNNQIIFLPYKGKFAEEHIKNFLKNKESQFIGTEVIPNGKSNNFSEKRQLLKFIQPPLSTLEKRKNGENFSAGNLRLLAKTESNSEPVLSVSYNQTDYTTKKPNDMISSSDTSPVAKYLSQEHLKRTHPLFSEELFNQKNSSLFKNHESDKQNYSGSNYIDKKQGRKADQLKLSVTYNKNKSLDTLIKSGNSSYFPIKKIFNNSLSHNTYRGMYLDNDFSDSEKKTVENEFLVNSQEQNKWLKNVLPYSEILKDSLDRSTNVETKSDIETNLTTTIKVENVEKVFATKATKPSPSVLKINYLIKNETKNLEPTTTVPEIQTFNFSEFIDTENFGTSNALFRNKELNNPTLLPSISTQNKIKKLITKQTVTGKESSSKFLSVSSTSQTTSGEILISKFQNNDSSNKATNKSEVTESAKTRSPEDEGLTNLIVTESTLTTDFLTTNKKDQETFGKNSRKMHFNQFLTTRTPDHISQSKYVEQRRSDILIDELDDYFLQESVFSSNYMKKLKQNNNLNSSSDFIIQLIPFVINDLRENKISSEDLPVLSKAFGGYWPAVLILANSTNLDMLPLIKMKNEKDLRKILKTFFPEESETSFFTSIELKEADRDKFLAYYYEDEYTDLSKELQEYWKNEETFKRDIKELRYSKNVSRMEQTE